MSKYTSTERVVHRLLGAAYQMTHDQNYDDAIVAATHAIVYWRKQQGDDISVEDFEELSGIGQEFVDELEQTSSATNVEIETVEKTNNQIVLEAIAELQPTTSQEISDHTDLDISTVYKAVTNLADRRAIIREQDGVQNIIRLTDIGGKAIHKYQESDSRYLPKGTWDEIS